MAEGVAAEVAVAEGAAGDGRATGRWGGKGVGQAEGSWLGQGCLEEGEVRGARQLPRGANPKLDRLCELRRKPRIRRAHSLTADTTVSHGHGQMHSKFWLLHFVSTQALFPSYHPYTYYGCSISSPRRHCSLVITPAHTMAAPLRLHAGTRAATHHVAMHAPPRAYYASARPYLGPSGRTMKAATLHRAAYLSTGLLAYLSSAAAPEYGPAHPQATHPSSGRPARRAAAVGGD